jgi:hypothetical protein
MVGRKTRRAHRNVSPSGCSAPVLSRSVGLPLSCVFDESQILESQPDGTVVSADPAAMINRMAISRPITYPRNGSKPARKHLNG